jgi:hypothetical protein
VYVYVIIGAAMDIYLCEYCNIAYVCSAVICAAICVACLVINTDICAMYCTYVVCTCARLCPHLYASVKRQCTHVCLCAYADMYGQYVCAASCVQMYACRPALLRLMARLQYVCD